MPIEMGALAGIAGAIVIPIYAIDRSSHVFHRIATSSMYLEQVSGKLQGRIHTLDMGQAKMSRTVASLDRGIASHTNKLVGLRSAQEKVVYTNQSLMEHLNATGVADKNRYLALGKSIDQEKEHITKLEETKVATEANMVANRDQTRHLQQFYGVMSAGSLVHETFNRFLMLSAVSFAALAVPVVGAAMVIKDYQQQLVNASSILELSRTAMYALGEEAIKLSTKYSKSATEISAALYHMACLKSDGLVLGGDFRVHEAGDYSGESGLIDSRGVPQKVKHYMKRVFSEKVEEKMFSIKPHCLREFGVTGNHPVFAIRGNFCKPSSVGTKLCKPSCVLHSNCTKLYHKDYKPEWIRADNLKHGDILMYPKIKVEEDVELFFETSNKSLFKPPKFLDEDFAYFLGLIMGDGWAEERSGRVSCVFANKDKNNGEWFKDYIKKIGHKCHKKRNLDGCFILSFCSVPLSKFIRKEIGTGAENKRFPPFLFKAKKEIVKAFLKGYLASDGCLMSHKSNNGMPRIAFTTVSPHIAYFINLLASKIGIIFSIGYEDKTLDYKLMPSGYFSKLKNLYVISTENPDFINTLTGSNFEQKIRFQRVWQDENYIYLPISWIKEEKYEGYVYNYETDDNTYSTGVIVHNSAGLKQNEIQQLLTPSMQLAIATQANYAQATKYLIQGMKAFNIEMDRGTEIADVYTWIIQHSLVTWDKLGESIKFAAPWFATTGNTIQELAAAIGVLTDRGLEAGIAGRGLRQAMSDLVTHSEVAGVSLYDTSGKMKTFSQVVFEFAEKFPLQEEILAKVLEDMGIRSATAFVSLVMGAESFREKLDGVAESAGTTARLANYQMNSIAAQISILTNKMLAPILLSSEFADKFQALLEPIGNMFYTAEGGVAELGKSIQDLLYKSLKAVTNIIEGGVFQKFIVNLMDAMVLMVPVWVAWSNILLIVVRFLNMLGPGGMQLVMVMYMLNKVLPIQTILAMNCSFAWRSLGIGVAGVVGGLMLFAMASNDAQRAAAVLMTVLSALIPVLWHLTAAKWHAAFATASLMAAGHALGAPLVAGAFAAAVLAIGAAVLWARSMPTAHEGGLVTRSGYAEIKKGETIIPEGTTHSPTIIFHSVGIDKVAAEKYGKLAAEAYSDYMGTH